MYNRLSAEKKSLRGHWELPAAWLLGLPEFPEGLHKSGVWPDISSEPEDTTSEPDITPGPDITPEPDITPGTDLQMSKELEM